MRGLAPLRGSLLKTLNVEQRLRFAARGVAVLRKLAANKKTMRHEKELCAEVGDGVKG
jgi:hypothetical protein